MKTFSAAQPGGAAKPAFVSVVLCTYNRAGILGETLESLTRQALPDGFRWELVLVDNNSADRTRQVAELFQGRLPLHYVFEKEQGLSAARNRGIREAKGDILIFTDDDILFEPDWMISLVRTFEEQGADCAGGRILPLWGSQEPFWLEDPELKKMLAGVIGLLDHGPKMIKADCAQNSKHLLFGGNMAFRRHVIEGIGGFRTDLGRKGKSLLCGEETEIFERIFRNGGSIIYNPGAVVHHKVPDDKISNAYLRRWNYYAGRSVTLMSRSARGGTGLWRIVEMFQNAVKAAVCGFRRQRMAMMKHDFLFWFQLGEFVESFERRAQ